MPAMKTTVETWEDVTLSPTRIQVGEGYEGWWYLRSVGGPDRFDDSGYLTRDEAVEAATQLAVG